MVRQRHRKLNSLGCAGDGDDIAILRDVERAFGVRILDSEAAQVRTVGQLYDLILAKLPRNSFRPDTCLSAVAFYRLRAALRRMGKSNRTTPRASLRQLIGRDSVRAFWRRLEQEAELAMPGPEFGSWGLAVLLACLSLSLLGPVLAGVTQNLAWLLLPVASLFGCWVLARTVPLQVPAEFASLGEFSRAVSFENFRTLADAGRTYRPQDVWNTLDYLIRKEVCTEQPIDRDTVFFDRDCPRPASA